MTNTLTCLLRSLDRHVEWCSPFGNSIRSYLFFTQKGTCYYDPHPKDGEGTVFSLFVSSHLGEGGYPSQVWGGYPIPRSQIWPGGYPIPGLVGGYPRYPPNQVWMGYPPETWDGVTPWTWDGVTPSDLGWGTPTTWDRVPPQTWEGVSPPDLGRGTPPDLGHSEHLLRGGRYASCVDAGGLSCWWWFCCFFTGKRYHPK